MAKKALLPVHFRSVPGGTHLRQPAHGRALLRQQYWSLIEINRSIERLDIATSGSLPVGVLQGLRKPLHRVQHVLKPLHANFQVI